MSTEPRASRIFAGLPPHAPGQRIGLYGGSFDPAHEGHRRIALLAMRRLDLDRLWWLVTPGNPLKDVRGLPDLRRRMRQAALVARHPHIAVSGVEARIGTRYTADLVAYLAVHAPGVRFVWIMGSDNLAGFHRWQRWREIAARLPIAVVNRPGTLAAPLAAPAAQALRRRRLPESQATRLAWQEPPAWLFLHGPRTAASSTALRTSAAPGRPAENEEPS